MREEKICIVCKKIFIIKGNVQGTVKTIRSARSKTCSRNCAKIYRREFKNLKYKILREKLNL